ncbi:hypothetical protein [Salmonella enterica]|uniref:hypothetical protein n=1 Tax=Salmonella enterica TaxID=28901 RepID=UPI0003BDC578|nr:hypothetical protein [Salmonella enterica]EBF8300085.1 hypothetical protein [Salmonella enterica subsp. enterica serovar Mbandaka]ECC3297997.1 hypothetical protein [Salmonella enterica subsp. enterica]APV87185.1 hypothetical protein SEEM1958_004085 [Salmonella enterica subsp. enterica serovar Mbandaka str. ATCC 51958]EDR2891127.1 hypothetical protein [Salmonella enterica subsp. enterica]EDR6143296.1 hypothetical protein [Salmonella enterica subsp. enterica]
MNIFTFRVLSISDIAKIRPGKYGMNYGVCIMGEVTQGEREGQILTFISPLGECGPADPTLYAYCRYWQGHYKVNTGDVLDGTFESEIQYAGKSAWLLSKNRFNEGYAYSLQF